MEARRGLIGYDPGAGNDLSRGVSNRSVQAGAVNLRETVTSGEKRDKHERVEGRNEKKPSLCRSICHSARVSRKCGIVVIQNIDHWQEISRLHGLAEGGGSSRGRRERGLKR